MVAVHEMGAQMALVPITSTHVPKRAVQHALRGNALIAKGELEASITEFTEALRLHPRFAAALVNRAAALGYAGRLAEALDDLNEALRQDPGDSSAFYNRALIKVMLDDYDGAKADLDQSLTSNASAAGYNNRGSVLSHMERHAEALQDFNRALELEPGSLVARFNRSGTQLALRNLGQALVDVDYVIAELPNKDSPQKQQAIARRRQVLDSNLRQLAKSGLISWSGGKPNEPTTTIELTPGPPISEWIISSRR
jgi:tetratricopeptide (TPR) repeat protein